MIKKAQIKFICITMSILFVVFAVIFGAIYFILNNVNERHVEEILDDTYKAFIESHRTSILPNGLVIVFDETGNSYQYFFDKETFTEESTKTFMTQVMKRPYTYGQINSIYYKIKTDTTNENIKIIVASDVTETLLILHTNTLNAFLTTIFIYGLLFFIVWILSFSVFRPIKTAFNKQKRFISDASHELKTPLTIITANTDVLQQEETNQWLDNIKSQTSRLDTLVADMLSLAKIDENKVILSKENFNLSQEVLNSTLPFDAVAFEKNKTLDINIEPNLYILGDKQSVKKIVTILVDNAIKYSSEYGKISVNLKKDGNKSILTVWNSGSNISSHEAYRIFERFYRGENSRSRESGGSGLGLSIAKGLADKNKWKITAESSLDEYMQITVIM